MSLTPRENFLRFFKGEPEEWTPTSSDKLEFAPAFIPDHVARGRVCQQMPFAEENYGGKDLFGVEWRYQPENRGSVDIGSLLEDIDDLENWKEKIVFPDYSKMDWKKCAAENKEYLSTDKIICTTLYSGLFERLISFVGFEDAAVALLDEDYCDTVAEIFDALVDHYLEYIRYLHDYFRVEYILFHDDWGTQQSTMFASAVYEDLIMPNLKKLAAGAHAMGVFIEQHSCGKIVSFIPLLAETGIDTWLGQPINNKDVLVEELGDRFKFGVNIAPPFYGDDKMDELIVKAREAKAKYAGKKVWFNLPFELSPAGKDKLSEVMKAM